MSITSHFKIKRNEAQALQEIVKSTNGRFTYFDQEYLYVAVTYEDPEEYNRFVEMRQEYTNLTKPIVEKKPAGFFKKIARQLIGRIKS